MPTDIVFYVVFIRKWAQNSCVSDSLSAVFMSTLAWIGASRRVLPFDDAPSAALLELAEHFAAPSLRRPEAEDLHLTLRRHIGIVAGVEMALKATLLQYVEGCPLLGALCCHKTVLLSNSQYCRQHFAGLERPQNVVLVETVVRRFGVQTVVSAFANSTIRKRLTKCQACSFSSAANPDLTLEIASPALAFVKLIASAGLAISPSPVETAIIPLDGKLQLPSLDSNEPYRVCGAVLLGNHHATAVLLDEEDQCLVYNGVEHNGCAMHVDGSWTEANGLIVRHLATGGEVLLVLAHRVLASRNPSRQLMEAAVPRMVPMKSNTRAFEDDMRVTFAENHFLPWEGNSCALDSVLFAWLVTIQPSAAWRVDVARALRHFLGWRLAKEQAPLLLALLLDAIRENSMSEAASFRNALFSQMQLSLIGETESNTTVDCQELWSHLAGRILPAIGIESTIQIETQGDGFCWRQEKSLTTMQRLTTLMVSVSECMDSLHQPDWLKAQMANPLYLRTCSQCSSTECPNKNMFSTVRPPPPVLVYEICWPGIYDNDEMQKVVENMRIPPDIQVCFYYLNCS